MLFKLAALIAPLSLDTFAVSTAIGMTSLSRRERLRLTLVFALFEGLMPLLGFAVGAAIGVGLGVLASYVAVALLAGVGVYMLVVEDDGLDDRIRGSVRGKSLLSLGLSVSLDELAIGVTIGLLRLPVLLVVVLIAAQAVIASQLGLAVGSRVGILLAERAEKIAGLFLVALAAGLLVLELLGRG